MVACLNDRMRVIECKIVEQFSDGISEHELLEMIKILIPVHCNQIVIAMGRSDGVTGFCREEVLFADKLRSYFCPLKIKIPDVVLVVNGQAISLESETR